MFNIFLKVIVIWPEQAVPLNQTESSVNDTISEEEKEANSEGEGEENVNQVINADWWQAAFNTDKSEEDYSDEEEDEEEEDKLPPLSFKVDHVNREGLISLKFSHPIYVPPQYSERLLCETNSPQNQIFEVVMSVNSDACVSWNTEIVEWTESEV